jgi:hypothetical protein
MLHILTSNPQDAEQLLALKHLQKLLPPHSCMVSMTFIQSLRKLT